MNKRTIDAFTLEIARGRITYVVWRGEASEADLRALREFGLAAAEKLGEGAGRKALVNARDATGFSRAARKELIELGREKPWDHVAFVGMRFEVKVLIELVTKAINTMRSESTRIGFVDTEAEGLAWLEEE